MRTTCQKCNMSDFAVVKTWANEGHTLRQLKCRNCRANLFSREYVMDKSEYKWRSETTERGTTRTYPYLLPVDKSQIKV